MVATSQWFPFNDGNNISGFHLTMEAINHWLPFSNGGNIILDFLHITNFLTQPLLFLPHFILFPLFHFIYHTWFGLNKKYKMWWNFRIKLNKKRCISTYLYLQLSMLLLVQKMSLLVILLNPEKVPLINMFIIFNTSISTYIIINLVI